MEEGRGLFQTREFTIDVCLRTCYWGVVSLSRPGTYMMGKIVFFN